MSPTSRDNGITWPGLFGVAALLWTIAATMAPASTASAGWSEASAQWLAAGPNKAKVVGLRLEDTSRPTLPHGKFKGSPSRVFKGKFWYPTDRRSLEVFRPGPPPCLAGPRPLVIYSHGFMSFNTEGRYLAEQLASYGYVVVAVSFPSTNIRAPGKPNLRDVVNQPGDVSFLIDTALNWPEDTGLFSLLTSVFDPDSSRREAAAQYLWQTLSEDVDGVTVAHQAP